MVPHVEITWDNMRLGWALWLPPHLGCISVPSPGWLSRYQPNFCFHGTWKLLILGLPIINHLFKIPYLRIWNLRVEFGVRRYSFYVSTCRNCTSNMSPILTLLPRWVEAQLHCHFQYLCYHYNKFAKCDWPHIRQNLPQTRRHEHTRSHCISRCTFNMENKILIVPESKNAKQCVRCIYHTQLLLAPS